MVRKRLYVLVLITALVALSINAAGPIPTQAQEGGKPTMRRAAISNFKTRQALEAVKAGAFDDLAIDRAPRATIYDLTSTTTTPDGRLRVIVELSDTPANVTEKSAGMTRSRALTAVRGGQQGFVRAAAGLGVSYIASVQYLGNYVEVAVPAAQLQALASLSGVRAIWPNGIVEREDTTSIPLIGAADAWQGGLTGNGIVIAVVDTGIDYTHTHFGGPGDYSVVPDRTTLAGVPAGLFPANPANVGTVPGAPKVIGGYDYVGDNYDASGDEGSPIPIPDPNPLDCSISEGGGHGTHVSGTAAGYGTTEPSGATYTGPYNSGTAALFPSLPNWSPAWRIGPGVAPEAALVAMKVFGCNGSTDDFNIIAAIEDSTLGTYTGGIQADVVNMSLGAAYGSGSLGPANPYNVVINSAAALGTAVVMSAGNNGDVFFIHGSPGSTNAGLSVASSVDTLNRARAIQRDNGTGAPVRYAAQYAAFGPFIHPPVTANLARPNGAATPAIQTGCTPSNFTGFPAGSIALVDRGACFFWIKAQNAFDAGAVGLIVANNVSDPNLVTMASDPGLDPDYDLPSVFITQASGNDLKSFISLPVQVTMDPFNTIDITELPDTLSGFSSRGNTRDNSSTVKPDISAPGNTILSAGSGTGNQIYNISGTSMSSPHMAGVMALLREKYPTWSVAELKALVINTANNNLTVGTSIYPPQRVGSGRVDVVDALNSPVIAFNESNPAGVSLGFGYPEVVAGHTHLEKRNVVLRNKGTTPVTYNAGITTRTDMPGVSFTVHPPVVTVPPRGERKVQVTLLADPNQPGINANTDPTLSPSSPTSRAWFSEESALLTFTPTRGSSTPLRLSLYAAPQLVSKMDATFVPLDPGSLDSTTFLELSGTGVETGAFGPTQIVSLITPFELVTQRPRDPFFSADANFRYLGITTDYPTNSAGDGYVFFALSTHGKWNTPRETLFTIFIDLDQDGAPEYAVQNGILTNADNFVSGIYDLNNVLGAGTGFLAFDWLNFYGFGSLHTRYYNTDTMVLSFAYEFLQSFYPGDTNPAFDYWAYVDSFDNNTGGILDSIGTTTPLSYNPASPAYLFTDASGAFGGPFDYLPTWVDLPGFGVPVDTYLDQFGGGPFPKIMAVHHHNGDGKRVEILSVQNPNPAPVQVSPSGIHRTDLTPVYKWRPVPDGEWYYYVVINAATGDMEDSAMVYGPTACSTALCSSGPGATLQNNTLYGWYVAAFNGGWSPFSHGKSFIVSVPPGPPVQISPEGIVHVPDLRPTYVWEYDTDALIYGLATIDMNTGALKYFVVHTASSICSGDTCQVKPGPRLMNGRLYGWYVIGLNYGGAGPWSAGKAFIPYSAPVTPVQVSPSGSSVNTPTYTWKPSDGATVYYLLVRDSAGNIVSGASNWYYPSCGETCSVSPGTALANGKYSWYVLAGNPFGTSAYSNGMSITVGETAAPAQKTPPPAPTFRP